MEKLIFGEYSRFTQKLIQIWDEYAGINSEIIEMQEDEMPVPEALELEKHIFFKQLENMILEGYHRWGKSAAEMRKDGWDFWMAEDKILRERRYGK